MKKFLKYIDLIYIGSGILVIIIFIIVGLVSGGNHKKSVTNSNSNINNNTPRTVSQISTNFSLSTNGDAHLSGIVINSIHQGTITSSSTINGVPVAFVIKTDSNTTVREANNALSSIDKLALGNVILVTGTVESFGQTVTLLAKDIRMLGNYQPIRTSTSTLSMPPRPNQKPVIPKTSVKK